MNCVMTITQINEFTVKYPERDSGNVFYFYTEIAYCVYAVVRNGGL